MGIVRSIAAEDAERALARRGSEVLAEALSAGATLRLDGGAVAVELPRPVLDLLSAALVELAAGRQVTLLPEDTEVTTQQAADLLNVSRPYLIQMLERGELPFRTVGTHRRVPIQPLLAFKEALAAKRRGALDELTALSQELGFEY